MVKSRNITDYIAILPCFLGTWRVQMYILHLYKYVCVYLCMQKLHLLSSFCIYTWTERGQISESKWLLQYSTWSISVATTTVKWARPLHHLIPRPNLLVKVPRNPVCPEVNPGNHRSRSCCLPASWRGLVTPNPRKNSRKTATYQHVRNIDNRSLGNQAFSGLTKTWVPVKVHWLMVNLYIYNHI